MRNPLLISAVNGSEENLGFMAGILVFLQKTLHGIRLHSRRTRIDAASERENSRSAGCVL